MLESGTYGSVRGAAGKQPSLPRTPASDALAPRTGPVSEKQQCTKSRLLRWCSGLGVPRAGPYGD
jgi:hypothetical protein